MSDSTFVAAMTALRTIEADPVMDSTARDSARAAVLHRYGLTADELEGAARAMAADPQHAVAVWRAIDQRSKELPPPTAP